MREATSSLNHRSVQKMLGSTIKEELDRIQYGDTSKYILIEQMPIGFGGQVSGRLLALKLALGLNRKAVFRSHGDPPYLQTFEPQYSSAPSNFEWSTVDLFDPLLDQNAEFLRFNYLAAAKRLHGAGDRIEDWTYRKFAQRYGTEDDTNVTSAIFGWMRLLPTARSMIDAEKKRLGISPTTLGVHLRRGDKSVENAYVPAAEVNRAISAIHEVWPFNSVFLASDSPKAAKEIRLPPGVTLIFDETEKRYNNANHKMLFSNPELAQEETFTALKNLILLASCGGIVGQDNAHFPVIASQIVASRGAPPERIVLLNGKLVEMNFPLVRRYYQVKRTVRARLRELLPQRWLQNRASRKLP